MPVATKSSQFISDTIGMWVERDCKWFQGGGDEQKFNVETQWNGKSNNVEINDDTFLCMDDLWVTWR